MYPELRHAPVKEAASTRSPARRTRHAHHGDPPWTHPAFLLLQVRFCAGTMYTAEKA
jgi:hypothetical protein